MKAGNKILFVLCAIAFTTGVAIYLEASSFQNTANVVQGTVANTTISRFEVKYTSADGVERTYSGNHGGKGRRFHEGEKLTVFYQIDNPDKSRISDGKKSGKKVIFWSLILLLFNLFSVYSDRKRSSTASSFKTTGRKVEAQILKTGPDEAHSVFDKIPFCIDCKWVDPITGKEYTHTIRYVWTDPQTLLAGRNSIDVYIDRNDPEKYFMDIEFLGPAAK